MFLAAGALAAGIAAGPESLHDGAAQQALPAGNLRHPGAELPLGRVHLAPRYRGFLREVGFPN